MNFLIRWIITSIAITVAAILIPGIHVEETGGWVAVAIMALVLGFMNAILRPILAFLSCGCIVATLGLFMLVINGIAFWAASYVAVNVFNIGFYVDGLGTAILGSIVVSVVSFLLSLFLAD